MLHMKNSHSQPGATGDTSAGKRHCLPAWLPQKCSYDVSCLACTEHIGYGVVGRCLYIQNIYEK